MRRTFTTVHRGTAPLVEALNAVSFLEGDYYNWFACESSSAKRLRQVLIAEHGANPKWIRASGYWRRGAARPALMTVSTSRWGRP